MAEIALTVPHAMRQAINEFGGGNFEQAAALCRRILEVSGDHFEALHLLAITLNQLNRLEEALDSFDRALKVQPDHAQALNNRGIVLEGLRRPAEALGSYDRALKLRPDYTEALNNRGNALQSLGRLDEAIESYGRALTLRPSHIEALHNQSNALLKLNEIGRALEGYDRVLELRPDYAEALNNRGSALLEVNRLEEALENYDSALKIRPDYPEALNNRGNALVKLNRLEGALDNFNRALNLQPNYVDALNNRGGALQQLRRLDEALDSFDHALRLQPNNAKSLYNRGIMLQELNRPREALESYDHSIKLRPGDVGTQWNRGLLLLLMGMFAEGWKGYEWRRKKSDIWTEREFPDPEWQGDTSPGTRLLLYAEQGLGDTIQFARFARMLAKRGLVVSLEVQRPLKGLLDGLENVTIFRRGENSPPYKAHCPLMSVPFVLQMGLDDIRAEAPPYLAARQDLVERWRTRLPTNGLRVGIAWQGDPKGKIDLGRSIPARAFAPLARMEGVTLISLQKNDGVDQLRDLPADMRIVSFDDLDRGPDAFLDTAAIMINLDLVITSDTSIAHLAGALGRPVWVALKHVPDWRWMLERGNSPWYPSMRLFRQSRPNDWDGVTSQIATALMTLAKQ